MNDPLPRIEIRAGHLKHEILSTLAATDSLKTSQLYATFHYKVRKLSTAEFVADHMLWLKAGGLVMEVSKDQWEISVDGLQRLRVLNDQVIHGPVVKASRRPFSKENYDGAELRNTSVRAGAYQAFKLPSRINGELVKGPQ